MTRIVETLQDTIDIIDFWKKPIEVKKLRGNIDTEILLANIPELNREARTDRRRDREACRETARGTDEMKATRDKDISYEVVRSRRSTADIVIERDGRILVRAPSRSPDERIEDIVEAKRYWIYKNLAEWRDLNATRVLREYRNGEGFLYLGRSYRLLLVADQEEPLLLKDGRFCLRRDFVDRGDVAAAKAAFRDYYTLRGQERIRQRVDYYAPKGRRQA